MPSSSQTPSLANYRLVAQESGVGKTTVGRVMQGVGYVSEATRRRVLKAAERLGYKPDPAFGVLARRRWPKGAQPRTATLAWIHHSKASQQAPKSPEYFGAQKRAMELGYSMDAFSMHDYRSAVAINRVIHARGIQGVLVQAFQDREKLDLDWSRFFVVFVGPENDVARVHNVQADFRSALHLGVRACKDRGYRRLGLALMNYHASGTNVPFRAQALVEREDLLKAIGPQPRIFQYELNKPSVAEFYQWFRKERPEVILATNIQPYYWLTSAPHYDKRQPVRKVPKDAGFLCLRNTDQDTKVAFMNLRLEEQGRQAVDLVHQQLQHGSIGSPAIPLRVLIPPAFVDGPSLRPAC